VTRSSVVLLAAAVVAVLLFAPAPLAPTRGAVASHAGSAQCFLGGGPASDGVISPGEYGETFFDGVTKILANFHCDASPERLLHVGLVSPWSGWVGLLVQAAEPMDGYANEVRLAYAPNEGGLRVQDAYRSIAEPTATADVLLGGRGDVLNVSTGSDGPARVFEFAIPLRSSDPYDSYLESEGPFYFAFEYSADLVDLDSGATALSSTSFVVEGVTLTGTWSAVEMAIVPPAAPPEAAQILLDLRDARGFPVPSAQLEVFVQTAFGFYEAGPVYTNEQGVASASFAPRDEGDYLIGAAYTGGYGLLASVAWQTLHVSSEFAGNPDAASLVGLRPVESLIVVIILGVWATYGYAFFVTHQSLRTQRPKAETRAEGPLAWRRR